MDKYFLQIVETGIVLIIVVILKVIATQSIRRISRSFQLNPERKRIIKSTLNILIYAVGTIAIIAIWSIDTKELFFFISSLLTALGIAFLAQWSILSNITASLVLFFKHPVKVGEPIKIMDKDYPIEGKLIKISLIFMHIQLENGEHITIPNNVVLNKIISVKED
jgi:small-conductance mechanosensitive channel